MTVPASSAKLSHAVRRSEDSLTPARHDRGRSNSNGNDFKIFDYNMEKSESAEIMPASLFYESKIYKPLMLKFLLDVGAKTLGWFLARIFTWVARSN